MRQKKRGFRPVVYSARQMPVDRPGGVESGIRSGTGTKAPEKRRFRELWLLPVKFYRRCMSPLFPGVCRYSPTCSAYCMDAVREWGVLRGTGLAVWRILRCNPFGGKGYDPVPPRRK